MPDFNIYEFLKKRPLSWSAMSSFTWHPVRGPEQWYRRYVLGVEEEPSEELKFGKMIDEKLQADPTFLPHIPRYPILQHEMKAMFGKIPLIGYADAFRLKPPAVRDYKTGVKIWDQERADETGQLTFYTLLLWLTKKIKPEDVQLFIDWMPTKKDGDFTISFIDEKDVKTFETKRSLMQVLEFGKLIRQTVMEMEQYARLHD